MKMSPKQPVWRRCLILVATFSFTLHQAAIADPYQPLLSNSLNAQEFIVGRDLGKPTITVNIVNGVKFPGVYHIPSDTDLSSLLSYAGGAPESSDLREVTIRRIQNTGGPIKIQSINLLDSIKSSSENVQLRDQDLVMIEPKFSPERTATWVSLVASIVSIGLSVALIRDINNR